MKKLIDAYKNMSPEMRMLFAAAGLGSFGTIVYTIDKWLFRGQRILGVPSMVFTALGIALLMGLLFGMGKLVSKGFSLRSKKRGERMIEDMSGDLGRGPVSMDAREAVKENNKKFFEEIREMRKQTKLNVYDLPWYIVIGDSGCGKTRLIEHSGLTFSRGRPEGYQLGTLNYNWWFTEDAIFIDMAGRLCNPQEDADHKEWQGFLNTVGKGRPACPINGAIVCISAEHLLEDAPEKIEGDANTMLERLRDLQGKLGVTFATYVVVTKCDKILGFMQFFDRAERDVEVRNQLVGWTRPAPFTELFDPEMFQEEFEHLYQRLNELRVRRLNDDADEEELGMAYCLPEEFRELRDPLQTYLRVLFPPIKNPRAIKNLVARGVYFTSSLQQGSVILKHLKERMGAEAGENIKPLEELYGKTKQKPLFIKHLLIRKVFPEYGLVFRNANEVARNKRYSRLLYIWSGVVAAVLFGLMAWGISGFSDLIGGPRAHAKSAVLPADKRPADLAEPAKLSEALGGDVDHVTKGAGLRVWMAAPLVINKREPINNLRVIQAGVFQRDMLPSILLAAGTAFEKSPGKPESYSLTSGPGKDADYVRYRDALLAYARWLRWGKEASDAPFKPADEGDKIKEATADLMTLIDWGIAADSAATTQPEGNPTRDAAGKYMEFLSALEDRADIEEWPHPAKTAIRSGSLSESTVALAVGRMRDYFDAHYATLSESHPDPVINEWMLRNQACLKYLDQYADFLTLADKDVKSASEFEELRKKEFTNEDSRFATVTAAFGKATRAWTLGSEGGGRPRIMPFNQALERVRKETWVSFAQDMATALGGAATGEVKTALAKVHAAGGGRDTLDEKLWERLNKAGMLAVDDQPYGAESFKDISNNVAAHVSRRASAVITVRPPTEKEKKENPDASATLVVTESAQAVQRHLNEIQSGAQGISFGADKAAAVPARHWPQKMIDLEDRPPPPNWSDVTDKVWKPDELNSVAQRVAEWGRRAETTNLLASMAERLGAAAKDEWGVKSLLSAVTPGAGDGGAAAGGGTSAAGGGKGKRRPLQFGEGGAARSGELRTRAEWAAVSPRVLRDTIDETVLFGADVLCNVRRLAKHQFMPDSGPPPSERCLEHLKAGVTIYLTKYVDYWSGEYPKATMESLRDLLAARTLSELQGRLRNTSGEVGIELKKKLGDVLEHICWSNQMRPVKSNDAQYDEEAEAAVRVLVEELNQLWKSRWSDKQHHLFIGRATSGAEADKGPDGITRALEKSWQRLSENIVAATLGPAAEASVLSKEFREARDRNGLTDERLTEMVLELANKAARLINDQLKDDLCAAQREFLGGFTTTEGWPYTSAGGVVDGPKFFKFLERIAEIEREIGPKAIADSAFKQFFDDCRAWRDFLGLSGGAPQPLRFVIVQKDPPPGRKGVQNYYKKASLSMGTDASGMPVQWKVPILEEEKGAAGFSAQWNWQDQATEGQLVLSELVDPEESKKGILDPYRQPFPPGAGTLKALDLCRLLKQHGGSSQIPVDIPVPNLPEQNALFFTIQLSGKNMPAPIRPPC